MSSRPVADPLVGRLVDGRYRVRSRIARGGMATVYLATDLRLERRVALKVMHHHLSDDDRFQTRFIQEARAAAGLSDPNVVSVFDQGQDGDIAYLVMEHLPGTTLRDLLNDTKRLSIDQAVTVMHAVLAGLASAHRAGFIHRDVKPENVLLAEDGRIKIGDFGLARATSANTASGQQLLGTIAYLAPELVTQGTADARTDIYALGIMLYEMLTGEQPYQGEQPMQIAYQHATEQVPRPSFKNPAVPEQLDELVLWSTERTPDERPADAQAMLERLREIEHDLGITPLPPRGHAASPAASDADYDGDGETALLPPSMDPPGATSVLPGTGPIASAQVAPSSNAERLRVKTRRRHARGWWAVIVVLALAIAAGGTGWWFGSGPGSMVTVPEFAADTTFEQAAAELAGLDVQAVEQPENSLDVPAGRFISIQPESGARLYPGDTVTITTSLGPAPVTLSSMRDMSRQQVEDYAADSIITVSDDVGQRFDPREAGTVIDAQITPRGADESYGCLDGCGAHQGDAMAITVSAGPIPDVAGQPADQARQQLEDAGLQVAETSEQEYSASVPAGAALRITPNPEETTLSPGDDVTLVESLGPPPVPVPSVKGMTRDEAVAALEAEGFSVTFNGLWNAWPDDWTTVTGSDPAAGTELVPSETEVTIYIDNTGAV
ncbi:MAG: Stk1 family PASTA domain-containing Ser/Thr kinase [Microbacterium gubbeenense]|uniref:Stk1 family PASTA domain-containing Ser/Thr kinase n=1 Tax=Microbacterium gubbeenense TaxID=159896 RepID=UPI003F9B1338